jgi:hypothetical protein
MDDDDDDTDPRACAFDPANFSSAAAALKYDALSMTSSSPRYDPLLPENRCCPEVRAKDATGPARLAGRAMETDLFHEQGLKRTR